MQSRRRFPCWAKKTVKCCTAFGVLPPGTWLLALPAGLAAGTGHRLLPFVRWAPVGPQAAQAAQASPGSGLMFTRPVRRLAFPMLPSLLQTGPNLCGRGGPLAHLSPLMPPLLRLLALCLANVASFF